MIDIYKICKKHGELTKDQCYIRKSTYKNKKYLIKLCKKCRLKNISNSNCRNKEKIKKYKNEWYLKNKIKLQENHREYRKNNKEKINKRNCEYNKNHKEQRNINSQKYKKRITDNITDIYLRGLLSNRKELLYKYIPQELIETYRIYIKLKRKIKELKNADK